MGSLSRLAVKVVKKMLKESLVAGMDYLHCRDIHRAVDVPRDSFPNKNFHHVRQTFLPQAWLKETDEHLTKALCVGGDTLPETNSSPLKLGQNPKGKDHLPTIHFQVRKAVSFREGIQGGPPTSYKWSYNPYK